MVEAQQDLIGGSRDEERDADRRTGKLEGVVFMIPKCRRSAGWKSRKFHGDSLNVDVIFSYDSSTK